MAANCDTRCTMRTRLRRSSIKWTPSSRRALRQLPIDSTDGHASLVARDEQLLVGFAARESAFARYLFQRGFIVQAAFLHNFRHAPRQWNFRLRVFGGSVLRLAIGRSDQQGDFPAWRFRARGGQQIV